MASVEIPGQRRRWGNESTNFYHHSRASNPGVPSRQKIYRCDDSQYTNCGHQHIGTKSLNSKIPMDTYGTASAFKLRGEDQRLPRPMESSQVHARRMSLDSSVNLYQSHVQTYQGSAMPSAIKRSNSDSRYNTDSLAASLNKAFYITSYQSDISKKAAKVHGWEPKPMEDKQSLCGELTARSRTLSAKAYQRVKSAPPLRSTIHHTPVNPMNPLPAPAKPQLVRRKSFTGLLEHYPSRAEVIREIGKTFPSPQPGRVSMREGRPSSAMKTIRIQGLRVDNK